jgi:tetratricopeptide (TPR) repeat protein
MSNQTTTYLSGVDIYYLAAFLSIITVIIAIFMFFLAILPYIKSKKDFSDLFIYRKVKELQQSDFTIQQPLHANAEVYKGRASDEAIKNSLKNHENVLVIGMPKSGKTRSLYQALKAVFPDFFVIKVPPKDVEQVRFPYIKRNYLVFFDDLNKFSDVNFDFNLFLKKIKARSKNVIVVSTCRSGDEFRLLNDETKQFKITFTTVVDLDEYELNKSEGEELAMEAGVTWKPDQFLGTPGSVILDIDDMRNRYKNSGTYERSILRACKLLKQANIFSYEKVLIRAICTSIFETGINESSWIDSINHLKENNLVTRSSIPKIDVYDPTLELVVNDYEPVDHLESLLSLLIRLEDAESLFYLGNAFYMDKKYENGEKSYKKCLRISPELVEAHNNLGNLLKDMGRKEDAEVEFRESLRINPDYAVAHYNLGFLLNNRGRKEDAEVEFREALRINPNFAEAHYNLGFLLKDMGRKEDAEVEFRESLRINLHDADVHNNLGILLKERGRKEDAEAEYREALRIKPDYAVAHNNLGLLLIEMGRGEDAEEEYREALRINPDYAGAHYNLGVLLKDMGKKEDAEAEFREALRINPDLAEAHGNLGILYSKTGSNEEAKKELEIAKRLFDEQGREADVKKIEELLKSLK